MTLTLDLFGEPTPLRLPLPDDTRVALQEQGITPPDFILLLLRQATPREVQWLAAAKMAPPATNAAARSWLEALVMRRAAEGTDERVVQELVKDMTPLGITMLTFAFTEGRVPDPKETALIRQRLLAELAASRPEQKPSSPVSTVSTNRP